MEVESFIIKKTEVGKFQTGHLPYIGIFKTDFPTYNSPTYLFPTPFSYLNKGPTFWYHIEKVIRIKTADFLDFFGFEQVISSTKTSFFGVFTKVRIFEVLEIKKL